ncbi:hypothetical protein SAMD00019534_030830, partial [Acytostelium subglobosum LB1]|uniref:hypothetical protein n=1 Tax=Acytostelium subglobosum LB1 TaxID=1410327 RepID=UPI000644992E
MSDTVKGNWSNTSAFNLELALKESREWIEAVCQQKFPSDDFQASLKNGVLLCKLINQIKPGIVPKVNQATTDFANRENLSFFIKAAKQLGLRDTQLFDTTDIYESKRIRNVAISLYWLGRAARAVSTYKGPQLNLLAFQKMNCSACKKPITDGNYLATLTQQWHTSCAKCCSCHCQLDPKQQFFMEGNNIWCPNCMVGAAGVSNKGAPAGKSHGHSHGHGNDDQCVGCHGSLEKGYVPDEKDESKKYCTSCICDLCHNPLIGNFNVINGQKICDECSCSGCAKPLKDGFFEEGLSRYCQPCLDDRNKKSQSQPQPSKATLTPSTATLQQQQPHQHQHQHPKTSTTSNDGCHECHKPLDNKPKVNKGDRDKFCSPHEKEKCCGGCDREVQGQVLQALDKSWHPQCFKCEKCNKDLTKPGESIKKGANGSPLCGPCAGTTSSKCGGCDKPVMGQGLEALDKKWHPQCFQCRGCNKKLNEEYVDVDNEPYCDPCAKNLSHQVPSQPGASNVTGGWGPNDKCSGCTSPLQGEVTKISKSYWHRGCFKCDQCKGALQTGYFLHGERPFCKGCHDKHEADHATHTCPKCNKPIVDGAIVQASGKMWHKACFSCTKCSKQIGDDSTFTRFSKPYCRGCFESEKTVCGKCRNQIQGEVVEDETGKTYCKKCAPAPSSQTIYGDRTPGFTIDPRSGKKTVRQ